MTEDLTIPPWKRAVLEALQAEIDGTVLDDMTDGQMADYLAEAECDDEAFSADPGRYRAAYLKYHYGMTLEEFEDLLDGQRGQCAICDEAMGNPCVDHDHSTGAVRGLLCKRCNTLIGSYRDSPSALRARADQDDKQREENQWIAELPLLSNRMPDATMDDKISRFTQAFEMQSRRCFGCKQPIPQPAVSKVDYAALDHQARHPGPILHRNRASGDAHLLCSDCHYSSPPIWKATSAVPPALLRRAAEYLESVPKHLGRRHD